MNFKYRVCGTQIEKLRVLSETARMVTFLRGKGTYTERKSSTFQNWFDSREDAITCAKCEASLSLERANKAVDAAREKIHELDILIKNLA